VKTLTSEHIAEITRRLVAALNPDQVYLFGSHAWGTPHEYSDVDLMVIVSGSELTEYQRAVKGHLALVGMGFSKDILVPTRAEFDFFRDVRGSLTYKVAHQGRLIYDRSQKPANTAMAVQSAQ
jgi:predicted nucleotidyltransferase